MKITSKGHDCLIVNVRDGLSTALQLLKELVTDVEEALCDQPPLFYTWHVDNKYFTADVNICCCDSEYAARLDATQSASVQATIFILDAGQVAVLDELKELHSSLQLGAEVSLVLNIADHDDCADVEAWCFENDFELVHLSQASDDHAEGLSEKRGLARIEEALCSHVWNNHVLKGKKVEGVAHSADDVEETLCAEGSFEEIFSKFKNMKEKADSLKGEDRKKYAEEVALAFMESLGIQDSDDEVE